MLFGVVYSIIIESFVPLPLASISFFHYSIHLVVSKKRIFENSDFLFEHNDFVFQVCKKS